MLKLVAQLGLADNEYQLRHDDQAISIPLSRPPNPSELDKIQKGAPEAVLTVAEFQHRNRQMRTLEEWLSNRVPNDILTEVPRSYDVIGDIAVVEIGPRLDPFAKTLANGILNIHPNVKCVFERTGPVEGSDRIRPLRHLAGDDRTVTVHREFGCSFKVDLSRAFFSPRLSSEHERVAKQVHDGEYVVDMFSGVGPFSILIAKTVEDVEVHAIDSNPIAARLTQENAQANKVDSKVQVHDGDAREVAEKLSNRASRVIMNHPSAARDFIYAACHTLMTSGGILHYYTFAKGEDSEARAKVELEKGVGRAGRGIRDNISVRRVREVGPMNWQIVVDARVS